MLPADELRRWNSALGGLDILGLLIPRIPRILLLGFLIGA